MAANNQLSHTPPTSWALTAPWAPRAAVVQLWRWCRGRQRGRGATCGRQRRQQRGGWPPVLAAVPANPADGDWRCRWQRQGHRAAFDANIAGPRPFGTRRLRPGRLAGYACRITTLYPRWSFKTRRPDFSAASVAMTGRRCAPGHAAGGGEQWRGREHAGVFPAAMPTA